MSYGLLACRGKMSHESEFTHRKEGGKSAGRAATTMSRAYRIARLRGPENWRNAMVKLILKFYVGVCVRAVDVVERESGI